MAKKGKSISIFSAKGGVGKTITTINLAGIYELIEKKVLIIDLDLYGGGISTALNKPSSRTIYNVVDDINNNRYMSFKDYVTPYDESIDILPSPKDPRTASRIDSKYIELILDRASYLYDVILIDMNHVLSEVNVATLDKVDKILFLITNDPLDIKNMKSLITIFKDLNKTNYKVLLNNSRDPFKSYFSNFDIKNVINTNIDYTLTDKFYFKDIEKEIMDGKIITLDPKISSVFSHDYSTLMTIGLDMIEGDSIE